EGATGAGADEKKPPALRERGDDEIHGRGDLSPHAADGRHRAAVLAIHERRDGARGHAVEGAASRVRALGGEARVAYSRGRHAPMLLLSNGMPRVESGLDVLVRRRRALLPPPRVALPPHPAPIPA